MKEAISVASVKNPPLLHVVITELGANSNNSGAPQPQQPKQQQQQQQQPMPSPQLQHIGNVLRTMFTSGNFPASNNMNNNNNNNNNNNFNDAAAYCNIFDTNKSPEEIQAGLQNLLQSLGLQQITGDIIQQTLTSIFQNLNLNDLNNNNNETSTTSTTTTSTSPKDQPSTEQQPHHPFGERFRRHCPRGFGGPFGHHHQQQQSGPYVDYLRPNTYRICDGCQTSVSGPYWRCSVCPDFDFCLLCKEKGIPHNADHAFTKISCENTGRHGGGCHGRRYHSLTSRYVADITIKDGTILLPNTPFTKIWRLRNEGSQPWPMNTTLAFSSGDRFSFTNDIVVNQTLPGQDVDISIDLVSPKTPGRYTGYWRLCSPEGHNFGQRIWVDIFVVPEEKKETDVVATEQSKVEEPVLSLQELQSKCLSPQIPVIPLDDPPKYPTQPVLVQNNVPALAQVPEQLINHTFVLPAFTPQDKPLEIFEQQPVVPPQPPVVQEQPIVQPPVIPEQPMIEEIEPEQPVPVQDQQQQQLEQQVEQPADAPLLERKRQCIAALVHMGFGNVPNLAEIIKKYNFDINQIVDHIVQ
eukprot:gene9758-11986_t